MMRREGRRTLKPRLLTLVDDRHGSLHHPLELGLHGAVHVEGGGLGGGLGWGGEVVMCDEVSTGEKHEAGRHK